MKFNYYVKTDTYYQFFGDDGLTLLVPSDKIILVEDESNLLSIKLLATRKTIGLVPKAE